MELFKDIKAKYRSFGEIGIEIS